MAVAFADKLRLSADAIGCVTQKELCARINEFNPATQFRLENAYKWFSGRAQPRSSGVYEDWARLLDLGKSGQFLANCSLDEFSRLLADRYQLASAEPAPRRPAAPFSLAGLLHGRFAAYSMSWSKAARGQIIRGSLEIESTSDDALRAHYQEQVFGGDLRFEGPILEAHRALHFLIKDVEHQTTLFFCCPIPAAPASVLVGLMAGSAYHDTESRPMSGRLLCVRQQDRTRPISDGNRYIGGGAGELLLDIVGLGYRPPDGSELGALCYDFLRPTEISDLLEVPLDQAEALIMSFDRLVARQLT